MFHRQTVPSYFGGLPGGYDYINNALAGTPALVDGIKMGGPNAGTYFVAFGEDATSADFNRGLGALAENTDTIDDLLHRDIAVTARTDDAIAGGPITLITIVGPGIFVGAGGTPNTPEGINTFVEILDNNDNEIVDLDTGVTCRVTAISPETPGDGFSAGDVDFTVSPAIPMGTTYRVYYGVRSNLATLPVDAFTAIKVRAAEEVSGAIIGLGGSALVGSAAITGTGAHLSFDDGSVFSQLTALFTRYNLDWHNSLRTRNVNANAVCDDTGFRDRNIFFTAASVTFTLPDPTLSAGRELWLADVTGTLEPTTPTAVNLAPFGSEKIQGTAATYKLTTANGRWRLSSDGVDWFLFSC